MAIHKVKDDKGVHYYDDDEYKHQQKVGCLKKGCAFIFWGAVILIILILAAM